MNKERINDLLALYFEGETSVAQERELKSYFNTGNIAEEHMPYKGLFDYFSLAQEVEMTSDLKMTDSIDVLLDRYFEGSSSIEDERALKTYFNAGEVDEKHKEFTALFMYFTAAKEVTFDKELNQEEDIDDLLEKYFEGESSIEEERKLKAYFNSDFVADEHKQFSSMFEYFSMAQAEKLESAIELDLNKKEKKSQLRIVRRRLMAVAAGLALLISSIFVMKTQIDSDQGPILSDAERIEAEEALETTMEALAMLGVQFNKGTESMSNIKALGKASILKN